MTKQHFEYLASLAANVIRKIHDELDRRELHDAKLNESITEHVIASFTTYCILSNPRFDEDKFKEAVRDALEIDEILIRDWTEVPI